MCLGVRAREVNLKGWVDFLRIVGGRFRVPRTLSGLCGVVWEIVVCTVFV